MLQVSRFKHITHTHMYIHTYNFLSRWLWIYHGPFKIYIRRPQRKQKLREDSPETMHRGPCLPGEEYLFLFCFVFKESESSSLN